MRLFVLCYLITSIVALSTTVIYDLSLITSIWELNPELYRQLNFPAVEDSASGTDVMRKLLSVQLSDERAIKNEVTEATNRRRQLLEESKNIEWKGYGNFIDTYEKKFYNNLGVALNVLEKNSKYVSTFVAITTFFEQNMIKNTANHSDDFKRMIEDCLKLRIIDMMVNKFKSPFYSNAFENHFRFEKKLYDILDDATNYIVKDGVSIKIMRKYYKDVQVLTELGDVIYKSYMTLYEEVKTLIPRIGLNNLSAEDNLKLNLVASESKHIKDYNLADSKIKSTHFNIILSIINSFECVQKP